MLIYRVENDKQYGPYQSRWAHSIKLCDVHGDSKHPSSYDYCERLLGLSDVYRIGWESRTHGFCNLAKLNEWFRPKWRRLMREHGFKVSIYEVNPRYVRVGNSGRQHIFDITKAKLKSVQELE